MIKITVIIYHSIVNNNLFIRMFFFFFFFFFLLLLENGNCINSIYNLIFSFRESKESNMPEFNSNEAIEAFNMIKRVKDNISSGNSLIYIFYLINN